MRIKTTRLIHTRADMRHPSHLAPSTGVVHLGGNAVRGSSPFRTLLLLFIRLALLRNVALRSLMRVQRPHLLLVPLAHLGPL